MSQLWRRIVNWLSGSGQEVTETASLEAYSDAVINPKVTSSGTQVIVPKHFQFTHEEVQSVVLKDPIISVGPARLAARGGGK